MQYSSFWNMYLYNPESSVYILSWHPERCQGVYWGHRPPARFISGPTLLLKSLTLTPSLTTCQTWALPLKVIFQNKPSS